MFSSRERYLGPSCNIEIHSSTFSWDWIQRPQKSLKNACVIYKATILAFSAIGDGLVWKHEGEGFHKSKTRRSMGGE